MPLLLVDAHDRTAAALATALRADGYDVELAATGASALLRLERQDVDAIIVDPQLPDMADLQVLTAIRARGVAVPVVVIGQRTAGHSCVTALDGGADDYLVRPFDDEELRARLRALLRRAAGPRWAPLSCNGLVLRDDDLHITIAQERVSLSPREHALLEFLLRRKGEAVGRKDILQHVFGYAFDPKTNLVTVHIANLRRKIGPAPVQVETVRGFGYRLRAADAGVAEPCSP